MLLAMVIAACSGHAQSAQIHIEGPPGSVGFGAQIAVLPNGNIVVTDPRRAPNGAAYLYSPTGQQISTVENISTAHSFTPFDSVKIVVLNNGNYLLVNTRWQNGSLIDAGMVAWASGEVGLSGTISSANALVGTTAEDRIGLFEVLPLANGNYVVASRNWNNGSERVGAVTWGSGDTGVAGPVTKKNSLVGTSSSSFGTVTTLTNGNYVIVSSSWGTHTQPRVGALLWADGEVGATGYMTAEKVLIGSTNGDFRFSRVHPLSNGNYVFAMPYWDNGGQVDAGATMWADGSRHVTGVVSAANALVGTRAYDFVGRDKVQPLTNGNYVVVSSDWKSATGSNVGAVTWGNGETGITGEVSAANSLIGSADYDYIGGDPVYDIQGVTALANGHYVVASPRWGAGRGAITWGDGTRGITGVVSAQNSLIGTTIGDQLGVGAPSAVTPLTNGNYVVASSYWHNTSGVAVGAAKWLAGGSPQPGTITAGNALIGSPNPGGVDVTPLSNGNYVVAFSGWDRGAVINAGAVAWGNGAAGTIGQISPANALVGAREFDFVGWPIPLSDGNYVVCSQQYSTSTASSVGAVTWGSGWGGLAGEINESNSLIGSTPGDSLCSGQYEYVLPQLPDGRYIIASHSYDDGPIHDAGAFTLGEGPLRGRINPLNSVIGAEYFGGSGGGAPGLFAAYDVANARMAVGRPASNLITLMRGTRIFQSGFGAPPLN
jgi:hypothetical protein